MPIAIFGCLLSLPTVEYKSRPTTKAAGNRVKSTLPGNCFLRAQQHVPLKFQPLSPLVRDREAHPKRAAAAFTAVFIKGLHLDKDIFCTSRNTCLGGRLLQR